MGELLQDDLEAVEGGVVVDGGVVPPDLEELGRVEDDGKDQDGELVELEVVLRDESGLSELAEEADADVPLETDEDGAVDGGHKGNVDHGHEVGADAGHHRRLVLDGDVGEAVSQGAAEHHDDVEEGEDLEQLVEHGLDLLAAEDDHGRQVDDDAEGGEDNDNDAKDEVPRHPRSLGNFHVYEVQKFLLFSLNFFSNIHFLHLANFEKVWQFSRKCLRKHF